MIRINITDEQGTLLGSTTLDTDDLGHGDRLNIAWVGEKIMNELPSHPKALAKLLEKQEG